MTIFAYVLFAVGAVGMLGMAHSFVSLRRNQRVYEFENALADAIYAYNMAQLAAGSQRAPLPYPKSSRYTEAVSKFWTPLTIERWYPEYAPFVSIPATGKQRAGRLG